MQEGGTDDSVLLPLDELIVAEQIADRFAYADDGFAGVQRKFARKNKAERRQADGEAQAALVPPRA
jgi:hypothetical protein